MTTFEQAIGVPDDKIDRGIGVVYAKVESPIHGSASAVDAWIVTADVALPGQGLGTRNLVYHKLCGVIDAQTGRFIVAYAADPS